MTPPDKLLDPLIQLALRYADRCQQQADDALAARVEAAKQAARDAYDKAMKAKDKTNRTRFKTRSKS